MLQSIGPIVRLYSEWEVTGLEWLELETERSRRHFLGNNRQVTDYQAACEFVHHWQVVAPWPTKAHSVPLPSLRAAYPLPVEREPGPIWNWKDQMPIDRQAFYGLLGRHHRVLLAPTVLPAFYRAVGRTGDGEDYLIDYADGQLSHLGKQVLDLLVREDCFIQDLRQQLQRRGADCSRLPAALDELRAKLYITHTGVISAGRRYGFIWGLVDRHWSSAVGQAMEISKAVARERVLLSLVTACAYASWRELLRLTGWSELHLRAALQSLLQQGVVRLVDSDQDPNGAAALAGSLLVAGQFS